MTSVHSTKMLVLELYSEFLCGFSIMTLGDIATSAVLKGSSFSLDFEKFQQELMSG